MTPEEAKKYIDCLVEGNISTGILEKVGGSDPSFYVRDVDGTRYWNSNITPIYRDDPRLSDRPVKKRRVIADRAKLVRVLVDNGWVPDENGDFVHEKKSGFPSDMWCACGEEVYESAEGKGLCTDEWYVEPEWTEEYEA